MVLFMANKRQLKGEKIGRLTVVDDTSDKCKQDYCKCICSCGNIHLVKKVYLVAKSVKSCGCGHIKNDKSLKRERASYKEMLSRCQNKNRHSYKYYGGRGISVCARWNPEKGGCFNNFIEDMGRRPNGFTLDRIDNDGDYSPENCRWADFYTQSYNKSNTVRLTHGSKTKTIPEWAEFLGIPESIIKNRYFVQGLTDAECLGLHIDVWVSCKNMWEVVYYSLGYRGYFEVHRSGKIIHKNKMGSDSRKLKDKVIKPTIAENKSPRFTLGDKDTLEMFVVARIIAFCFIDSRALDNNYYLHFKDGDNTNVSADNLILSSKKTSNMKHVDFTNEAVND